MYSFRSETAASLAKSQEGNFFLRERLFRFIHLWYRPLSSLRTQVQCDAVSYSQSQILTLAIRLVPGTCQF